MGVGATHVLVMLFPYARTQHEKLKGDKVGDLKLYRIYDWSMTIGWLMYFPDVSLWLSRQKVELLPQLMWIRPLYVNTFASMWTELPQPLSEPLSYNANADLIYFLYHYKPFEKLILSCKSHGGPHALWIREHLRPTIWKHLEIFTSSESCAANIA